MTHSGKSYTVFCRQDLCKQCQICIKTCPRSVLEADEKGYPIPRHPQKCHGCQMCFLRCPDFALEVIEHESSR